MSNEDAPEMLTLVEIAARLEPLEAKRQAMLGRIKRLVAKPLVQELLGAVPIAGKGPRYPVAAVDTLRQLLDEPLVTPATVSVYLQRMPNENPLVPRERPMEVVPFEQVAQIILTQHTHHEEMMRMLVREIRALRPPEPVSKRFAPVPPGADKIMSHREVKDNYFPGHSVEYVRDHIRTHETGKHHLSDVLAFLADGISQTGRGQRDSHKRLKKEPDDKMESNNHLLGGTP
jgi:hypothetical protein